MKKTYTKPEFYYEKFSLIQSIAAGCQDTTVNSGSPDTCEFMTNSAMSAVIGGVYFSASNNDCNLGDEELIGMCYNYPEGEITVFSS